VVKVAAVTPVFWLIKVLTTGAGETTSDYLARTFDPVLAVGAATLVLVAVLVAQVAGTRYRTWLYWLAVTLVAIVGTMVADAVHVVLGVPYLVSTVAFLCATVALLVVWRATQSTIAVHSITTRTRECFYWATVAATFALGTAVGDLTATETDLGYLGSGILFAVLIALPALAYRLGVLAAVPAFWAAYVLTRPLGASFADWLGRDAARGGVGLGTGLVSVVLLVVIAVLVGTVARREDQRQPAGPGVI
jgi:uncharacterized membrane-anchored protein